MADDRQQQDRETGHEAIRIVGAEEASRGVVGRAGADGAPSRRAVPSARPAPSWDDEDDELWDDGWEDAASAGSARSGSLWDSEDELPEAESSDRDDLPEDEPVTSRGPIPSAAPVPAAVDADSEDTGAWASMSAPRWRSGAEDWDDVDREDPRLLGDDDTNVGTLDPSRAESSDRFRFDDDEVADDELVEVAGFDDADEGEVDDEDSWEEPSAAAGRRGGRAAGTAERRGSARSRGSRGPGSSAQGAGGMSRPAPSGSSPQSALGARVGTGVVLVAVALILIKVLERPGATGLVSVALAVAALELFTALRQRGFQPAILPVVVSVLSLPIAGYLKGPEGVVIVVMLATVVTLLWFLLGVVRDRPVVNLAVSTLALLYLGGLGSAAGLVLRSPHGIGILLAGIAATIGYDVFGFFVGMNMGRLPLAPDISPNKTVEGLLGGVAGSLIVSVLVFGIVGVTPWDVGAALALGLVVGVLAPLGDLCESMIKRDLGIKDMGSALPGHGGVLDRIDAMLFVMPGLYFVARIKRWV